MKKILYVIVAVLISFSLVFSYPQSIYAKTDSTAYTQSDEDLYNNLADIGSIMKYINDNYIGDVSYEKLKEAALQGIFSSLDDYSTYFTKDEFQDFTKSTSGTFSGTGMVLIEKDGIISVSSVIEGSPAEAAGILPGYIIKSVDGNSVNGLKINDVVKMILGEEGTKVKITFEIGKQLKDIELTRQLIRINPVTYRVIDGIGYIKIQEFNENTTTNLKAALKYMDDKGITKIVLDLRDNPGGLLIEAVNSANLLVPAGVVVTIEGKNKESDIYYSYLKDPKYKLGVLINHGTASAAEILAGAIQDTKIGTLIGEKSFGKGTVQTIIPLSDGSGFKLTIARYILPSGRIIDKSGLSPDIFISNTNENSIFDFKGNLKAGSVGDYVKRLQKSLNLLKFNAGIEDGIFGPKTEKALKDFQLKADIKATGIFDKDTYEALIGMIVNNNKTDTQLNKAVDFLKNINN